MTYLQWLKQQGKALVIRGPQGCGKTLLARQLADENYAMIREEELQSPFNGWLMGKTVIVEDVHDAAKLLDTVKPMIVSAEIRCTRKGKETVITDTPNFIFCTSNPEPLDFGVNARRFYVIDMDT